MLVINTFTLLSEITFKSRLQCVFELFLLDFKMSGIQFGHVVNSQELLIKKEVSRRSSHCQNRITVHRLCMSTSRQVTKLLNCCSYWRYHACLHRYTGSFPTLQTEYLPWVFLMKLIVDFEPFHLLPSPRDFKLDTTAPDWSKADYRLLFGSIWWKNDTLCSSPNRFVSPTGSLLNNNICHAERKTNIVITAVWHTQRTFTILDT